MMTEGLLAITEKKLKKGMKPVRVFTLKAGFKVNVDENERDAIREGLGKIRGKTGREVSRDTHEASASWKRKANGQILDIYEDLLTPKEFAATQKSVAEAKAALDKVLG